MSLESAGTYTAAQKAIVKKLGDKAVISDDYNIACYGHTAYLEDRVVRSARVGSRIPTDTITWEESSRTVTLYRYKVAAQTSDDCGNVARNIMAQAHGVPSTTKFVTADPANENALSPRVVTVRSDVVTYRRNEHARPDIGEAYVTIPPASYKESVQFHWGAVLAKSGGDVLTLEGFAGTGVDNWSFELNSQTKTSPDDFQSFHVIWSMLFQPNHTFVVKPQGAGTAPVTTGQPAPTVFDWDAFAPPSSLSPPMAPTVPSKPPAPSGLLVSTPMAPPTAVKTGTTKPAPSRALDGLDFFFTPGPSSSTPAKPTATPSTPVSGVRADGLDLLFSSTSPSPAPARTTTVRSTPPPSPVVLSPPPLLPIPARAVTTVSSPAPTSAPVRSSAPPPPTPSVAPVVPTSIAELKREIAKILATVTGTAQRQRAVSALVKSTPSSILANAIYDIGLQETLKTNGLKLQ